MWKLILVIIESVVVINVMDGMGTTEHGKMMDGRVDEICSLQVCINSKGKEQI